MSVLTTLFQDFTAHLGSTKFLLAARHTDHPTAFSRRRKLPLVAIMLTGMRMSIQAKLDTFFAHLRQQAQLIHEVSEQAFAQARAKLSLNAIPGLNDWLVARAETDQFVPRWCGLRLVAADASTVRFGLRASHVKRAALADQILFGLFLPGPDLMLAASLHYVHERGERQFLFEHLDRLSPDDLLLLDRGYPCHWLVAVLNDRAIKFCMRVDNTSGFACVRAFMRSKAPDQVVMLPAPNKRDALDYECSRKAQRVRLLRNVSPGGEQRVLMTNLLDDKLYPADCFGELYHKRWGIEEAFKRLKHRLNRACDRTDPASRGTGCRRQNRLRQPADPRRPDRACRRRSTRQQTRQSCLCPHCAQTAAPHSSAGREDRQKGRRTTADNARFDCRSDLSPS